MHQRYLRLDKFQYIPRTDGTLSPWQYLHDAEPTPEGKRRVVVMCECGDIATVRMQTIRAGASNHCRACFTKWTQLTKSLPLLADQVINTTGGIPSQWVYLGQDKVVKDRRIIRGRCQKCGHEQWVNLRQIRCTGAPKVCLGCENQKGVTNE